MTLVTVSRQTGSLGDEVASALARKLGIRLITREFVMENWLPRVASSHELHMLRESSKFYRRISSEGISFADYIEERLRELVDNQSLLIQGLGSQVIFRGYPTSTHIRILASDHVRVTRISRQYGLDPTQAERTLELSDRRHRRYVWRIHGADWSDPALYHLCLNTDGIDRERACEVIIHFIDLQNKTPAAPPGGAKQKREDAQDDGEVAFAHPSEEEFARILNLYQIPWDYEPTTFPLEWNAEGDITMAFTPDFYLPEFDTYIELTTMSQKYVTEKNRKVRLLKELYPEVSINIVYKRDYHTLLRRFGIQKRDVHAGDHR